MGLQGARISKFVAAWLVVVSGGLHAEVLFQENFDDQPDWNSGMHVTDPPNTSYLNNTLPEGWHALRQTPAWAPSTGHPDRHEVIEISSESTSENPNRARGRKGKSFVTWRDSRSGVGAGWNSDGILFYRLPSDGYNKVYVEFWINFSDEFIDTFYRAINGGIGQGKIFRIMSHDFPDDFSKLNDGYTSFFGNDHKPAYYWGFSGTPEPYGFRNKISIYRHSGGKERNDYVTGFPRAFGSGGDNSLWYSKSAMVGAGVDGSDTTIKDLRNGGVISRGPVMADQVFGDESVWVKVGQYVEMNSAPGVPDGKLQIFINDQRILDGGGIEWVTVEQSANTKWNLIGFGGNDYFKEYPNELRHEQWYAIDDIVIRSDLPDNLKSGNGNSAPFPPKIIEVR